MKHLAALCLLLSFVFAPALLAEPVAEPTAEEAWFVMLNGQDRIGYMHTTEATAANGNITTGQYVKIVMARAGTRIEIGVESSFIETADGKPIEATSKLSMGGVPMTTRAVFHKNRIEVTAGQGDRVSTTNKRPIEGDWLPPAAMSRVIETQLTSGAEVIEVRTVDITSGLTAIDMRMTVLGREDIEVYGKTVPAIVWDATVSIMPGITMREYVDEQGQSIKSTIALMPGMELTVMQADKELALSKLTPAEMMAQTFVVPSRKIQRPRELKRAVYRLRTKNGKPLPKLPTLGAQRYDGAGQLVVDTSHALAVEKPDPKYLQASPVLNHKDPAVQEIYAELLGSLSSVIPLRDAEILRQGVHRLIDSKDLSVGFATASDVARTKQGDCTEHAVLLAALLRAAGTPSRCVSGLVYADQFAGHEGIFGYHMWAQAWIDSDGDGPKPGRWIDFDATLPGVSFDATHLALSVSAMNDGLLGNDMAALLPLLGNLEIEVVETGYGENKK